MKSIPKLSYSILSQEVDPPIQERVTIKLNKEDYDRLKEITDIKEVFIKDVVSELISIYNQNAITDPDFKERVQEEKDNLSEDIKGLLDLQSQDKEPTPTTDQPTTKVNPTSK